jgi:hypothetical protein
MKKLIYAVIIVALATTSNAYSQKKTIDQENYENYRKALESRLNAEQETRMKSFSNKTLSNLVPENFQTEEIFFSDKNSMRSAKISEMTIEKDELNQSSLRIKIEFTPNKSQTNQMIYLSIKDRSLKSFGNLYGFQLMNSTSCYDEEIFIKIENPSMELWFQGLLEGLSGKKITTRFDSKE